MRLGDEAGRCGCVSNHAVRGHGGMRRIGDARHSSRLVSSHKAFSGRNQWSVRGHAQASTGGGSGLTKGVCSTNYRKCICNFRAAACEGVQRPLRAFARQGCGGLRYIARPPLAPSWYCSVQGFLAWGLSALCALFPPGEAELLPAPSPSSPIRIPLRITPPLSRSFNSPYATPARNGRKNRQHDY